MKRRSWTLFLQILSKGTDDIIYVDPVRRTDAFSHMLMIGKGLHVFPVGTVVPTNQKLPALTLPMIGVFLKIRSVELGNVQN